MPVCLTLMLLIIHLFAGKLKDTRVQSSKTRAVGAFLFYSRSFISFIRRGTFSCARNGKLILRNNTYLSKECQFIQMIRTRNETQTKLKLLILEGGEKKKKLSILYLLWLLCKLKEINGKNICFDDDFDEGLKWKDKRIYSLSKENWCYQSFVVDVIVVDEVSKYGSRRKTKLYCRLVAKSVVFVYPALGIPSKMSE